MQSSLVSADSLLSSRARYLQKTSSGVVSRRTSEDSPVGLERHRREARRTPRDVYDSALRTEAIFERNRRRPCARGSVELGVPDAATTALPGMRECLRTAQAAAPVSREGSLFRQKSRPLFEKLTTFDAISGLVSKWSLDESTSWGCTTLRRSAKQRDDCNYHVHHRCPRARKRGNK